MNNRSLSFPYGIHEDASAMHLKESLRTHSTGDVSLQELFFE